MTPRYLRARVNLKYEEMIDTFDRGRRRSSPGAPRGADAAVETALPAVEGGVLFRRKARLELLDPVEDYGHRRQAR